MLLRSFRNRRNILTWSQSSFVPPARRTQPEKIRDSAALLTKLRLNPEAAPCVRNCRELMNAGPGAPRRRNPGERCMRRTASKRRIHATGLTAENVLTLPREPSRLLRYLSIWEDDVNRQELSAALEHLHRQTKKSFDRCFKEARLTSAQALALDYIMQKSETEDVFPKDLENVLQIRPPSVTNLIGLMERNGYLRREPLERDGRYVRLVPTEKALAIRPEITECIDAWLDDVLFSGFSEEELEMLASFVERITKNVS